MHTKGPWILFDGKHSSIVEILDEHGKPIVGWLGFDDSRRPLEEHKANARLIVAAPEQNSALIDLVALVRRIVPDANMLHEVQNADEAIRKTKDA